MYRRKRKKKRFNWMQKKGGLPRTLGRPDEYWLYYLDCSGLPILSLIWHLQFNIFFDKKEKKVSPQIIKYNSNYFRIIKYNLLTTISNNWIYKSVSTKLLIWDNKRMELNKIKITTDWPDLLPSMIKLTQLLSSDIWPKNSLQGLNWVSE